MVYLRVPTAVFYVIQASRYSMLQPSASACQHFSLGTFQQDWVSGLDGFESIQLALVEVADCVAHCLLSAPQVEEGAEHRSPDAG
jgi:hypothetical protein